MDIREQLCGAILNEEKIGNYKKAEALKKSAFFRYGGWKRRIRKTITVMSKFRKNKNNNPRVAVFIQDNVDLIKAISEYFDVIVVNPPIKLAVQYLKKGIEVEYTSGKIDKFFRELYEKKIDIHIKKELTKIQRKLLKAQCKIMIFPDDMEMIFRLYILAGRNTGIKSITIQHGMMDFNITPAIGRFTDYFFVWGKKYCELYEPEKKDNIFVMGYPYKVDWDKIEYKYTGNRVLFIGQPISEKSYDEIVENVYNACQTTGKKLCYRLHPSENHDKLKDRYSKLANMQYSEGNLEDDIVNSAVVIGLFSTVLLQALIYNKRVIQIDCGYKGLDFTKMGNVCRVNLDYEEIVGALQKKTCNNKQIELNEEYLLLNKNYARDVVQFIKEKQ